jgi:hypothetical protein
MVVLTVKGRVPGGGGCGTSRLYGLVAACYSAYPVVDRFKFPHARNGPRNADVTSLTKVVNIPSLIANATKGIINANIKMVAGITDCYDFL